MLSRECCRGKARLLEVGWADTSEPNFSDGGRDDPQVKLSEEIWQAGTN